MTLLLDTSVIIDFLRKKDKESAILFQLNEAGYSLAISILTHTEIFSGKSVWEDNKILVEIEKIFSNFSILPLGVDLSKKAGKIRANYGIDIIDGIIAATAIENDHELITLNEKDFKRIPGLRLFKENPLKN